MRFTPIENNPQYPVTEDTRWFFDTARPLSLEENNDQPFMAVQVEADKNPNDFRRVTEMRTLFTDQAEYYFVCPGCYAAYARMQWSGSTRGANNWQDRAEKRCRQHEATKGWCQFCDPVFGNGGWASSRERY